VRSCRAEAMRDAGKNPRLPKKTANVDFLLAIFSSSDFDGWLIEVATPQLLGHPFTPDDRLP
jgi:hypothetical protein